MEYEKTPTATFSRKMNNRSHSISFSANSFYDGVFTSPANAKSPLVDYGEIFRGSGPSPSSIPFLDVPELNDGKIMVDVRSSKLDYSSVFGGFGACDFAVTPEEVIIKSDRKFAKNEDRKRNRKKGRNSSHVPPCNEGNNPTSSPEMVRMKHSDISYHQTGPHNENGTTHLPGPSPTQLVDNMRPLQKIEIETSIPSVENEPCNEDNEKVEATRKGDSKTDVEFENIFGRNGCSTRDNSTCKTSSNAEFREVKPPSSLQPTLNGENVISERLLGSNSGRAESVQTEGTESPGSPTYFDAETDANSAAAESSAALKKAIEEAQVRMNVAKQMMERKKAGFRSCAKPKSCDDPKVEDKGDEKVEEIAEESRDNNSQILGGVVNSSQQSYSNEGDQHAKRARKLWKVPEELLKPTANHKPEESAEQDVVKLEEEQARRGRKHWELPSGIFKSVMNSKQQEPENHAPTKPETDKKQEEQPLAENPFYSFGHLGSKIKCVVEAFTGSKVSQKDEKQVAEEENSTFTQVVQGEESDSHEPGIRVMETYLREVEEIPQQTKSKRETRIEEKSESTVSTFTEGSSQKMEKETGLQVKSACESEGGPKCGVIDFQEIPDRTYIALDVKGEKEIVSKPQEMFVDPDDTKTYVREVEEIPTHEQSLGKTHFEDSVGTMVSFTENISEQGNVNEVKETVHKAPRQRRVWKTSKDVCNMIKAPKENNRPWQLESVENETTGRSFQEEGVQIYDVTEETGSTSEQASDSGLQENWTVLKKMFRQMFQTTDIKEDDETYCLVESEKEHLDIYLKVGDENRKETAETSYNQMTGTDRYEQDKVETVQTDYEASSRTRENEDLEPGQETYCRNEDSKIEMRSKMSSVRELIGEAQEAIGMVSDQEEEDVQEVFEEAGWAQGEGLSEVTEIKGHANSRAEMLEYDRSETDSNKSGENFEQRPELAEESKSDGSIDTDPSRSSFEMIHGDSCNEEVCVDQDLSDQFPEKASAASSTEEHVEELDSDSIQSGWSVVEEDDKFESYVEESLAAHLQDEGASQAASKPEEMEESKKEADEMKTSHGEENNEQNTEQEQRFECQESEIDRSNVEAADSSCFLPKGDEEIGTATYRNMKENDGEESCRSSMEEEGETTSDASQNEAELVKKHLKKTNEAKEKEREKERLMVERAIREARERALADAKERAGIAAMEKAKAKAHRRGTSEKVSVEANDKLSSAEKVSMQAKLRAERAAVERVLFEARERALEKALSGKSAAASQARSYGGSKSFGSSGERRGSSTSATENKSSGPSTSSNQTAKGEPIQRCKARSERHQRTSERAAEALAEKKLRDLKAQKEQAERNRLSESLDADVKRWSSGKEKNLRALLSTLQYILGAESGWKPIPLTDLVSSAAVRKAYRKATLYVHPDKLQQRGASTKQKYICEKVFDLLKEAWNKFGADER